MHTSRVQNPLASSQRMESELDDGMAREDELSTTCRYFELSSQLDTDHMRQTTRSLQEVKSKASTYGPR